MRCNLLLAALAAAAVMVSAPAAHALSVGAPGKALELGGSSISWAFGFTEMDVDDVDVDSKSLIFKGAVGATESLTPYIKIGFADLETGNIEGNLGFAWGGGALFELVTPGEESGLSVNLDLQVLWWDSEDGGVDVDAFAGQAALMGAIKSSGTTGYGGVAVKAIDLDGGPVNLDESSQTSLFFGVDYFIDFNFYFNLEAHLFGEDSITLGIGYLF